MFWIAWAGGALGKESVEWVLAAGGLGANGRGVLQLKFVGCDPDGKVEVPSINGLRLSDTPSLSRNFYTPYINGKFEKVSETTLSYAANATRWGKIVIPAFDVNTMQGVKRVPEFSFQATRKVPNQNPSPNPEVGGAVNSEPDTSSASGSINTFENRILVKPESIWEQQVFRIRYEIVTPNYGVKSLGRISWEGPKEGLILDKWLKPQSITLSRASRSLHWVERDAMALRAGSFHLPGFEHEVHVVTGVRRTWPFSQEIVKAFTVSAKEQDVEVKPLPAPPPGFSGAVGQFTLGTEVTPEKTAPGEPVTYTLTLKGTGNWSSDFEKPVQKTPSGIRTIQPKAKQENDDESLFKATWTMDLVLVPDEEKALALPPVTFVYFDPLKGEYETLMAKPETVTIEGKTNAGASSQSLLDTGSAPETATGLQAVGVGVMLPRDPVEKEGLGGLPPLVMRWVWLGSLTPFAIWLVVWIAWAMHKAWAGDEKTPRRLALKRLVKTLHRLETASSESDVRDLLGAWQSDVMELWSPGWKTPSVRALRSGLENGGQGHNIEIWSDLWREAEKSLYGQGGLSEDWRTRASQALKSVTLPFFQWWKAFLPKHLLRLTMACVVGLTTVAASGGELESAYGKGEFAGAEGTWREEVRENPHDWKSRYNLGLALYQQKIWSEAAAHWTSALLLNPRQEDVRWNLNLVRKKLPDLDSEVRSLIQDRATAAFIRLASPFEWQMAIMVSGWVGVAGLLLLTARWYGRWLVVPGLFSRLLVAGALCVAAGAAWALGQYQLLNEPDVAMVTQDARLYSVPTAAVEEQQKRTLGQGNVAVVEKRFLGWVGLKLRSGETGWTRREYLTYLYHE